MSPRSAEAGDYRRELLIAAPCERAFAAVATVQGVRGWWTPLVSGGAGDGAPVRLRFAGLDEHIDMRLVDSRPPRRASWSIIEHSSLDEWAGTTLRFEISSRGPAACAVAFRHAGLSPRLDCFEDCRLGWDHFLKSLAAFAEQGVGHPFGAA
jgi:uncharacterized protein YndB with AHSA1/START domain